MTWHDVTQKANCWSLKNSIYPVTLLELVVGINKAWLRFLFSSRLTCEAGGRRGRDRACRALTSDFLTHHNGAERRSTASRQECANSPTTHPTYHHRVRVCGMIQASHLTWADVNLLLIPQKQAPKSTCFSLSDVTLFVITDRKLNIFWFLMFNGPTTSVIWEIFCFSPEKTAQNE